MANSPMLDSDGDLQLSVFSKGALLDTSTMVVSVQVIRAINRIPSARLTILDGDMSTDSFPVSDSDVFKPGTDIRIEAGWGETSKIIFEGIVIKHGIRIDSDNFSRLHVECRDKSVVMSIGRKNANYINQKDSDIISKLVTNYAGLSADTQTTETEYKELVQYYISDWDFMLARAEANGCIVIAEAGKLSVKPPATSGTPLLTVTYGLDLIEFEAELDARTQLKAVDTAAWDPSTQTMIEQHAPPTSANKQGDLDATTLSNVIGLDSYRLQSTVALEGTSLKAWAQGRQVKSSLSRIRGRMKFQGNALAKEGSLIEIKGVGNRFAGDAYISAISHDIVDGRWVTEAEIGLEPDWFAERNGISAPSASGLTGGVQGLQIGVVKKLDEDPEGQHKIQVSVPVMQAEADGVWARLASSYGSDGFGAFFIPEIGDEVILGYFNNDPSHPVILGSLYSSKRKPPYAIAAENNTKAVVTRSKLTLEFDEEKKVITILTPGKNKIVISDDAKSILLSDQNGNTLELKPEGIVLDSPKDICLTAKGKVSIDAVGNIELSSKADLKSQALNINNNANIAFVAKGSASAELSASGQTVVKGALVMIN